MSSASLIEEFRESVTSILLSEDDFIDWGAVNGSVAAAKHAVGHLEAFRREGPINAERLTQALAQPRYLRCGPQSRRVQHEWIAGLKMGLKRLRPK